MLQTVFRVALLLLWATSTRAEVDPHRFVDEVVCADCHGEAVSVWQGTKHAASEDVGKNPNADAIVAALGMKSSDVKKPESMCASCHFTAGVRSGRARILSGVGCQSCHGPAVDWIKIHNDYGGMGITKATETEGHRSERYKAMAAADMVFPADLYGLATNCVQCHLVTNPNLVNTTEHPTGSNFDLVSRSQGEIKHYPDADAAKKTKLGIAGVAATLVQSYSSLAAAQPGTRFATAMQQKASDVTSQITQLAAQVGNKELAAMAAIVGSLELSPGNAALAAAATKLDVISRDLVGVTGSATVSTTMASVKIPDPVALKVPSPKATPPNISAAPPAAAPAPKPQPAAPPAAQAASTPTPAPPPVSTPAPAAVVPAQTPKPTTPTPATAPVTAAPAPASSSTPPPASAPTAVIAPAPKPVTPAAAPVVTAPAPKPAAAPVVTPPAPKPVAPAEVTVQTPAPVASPPAPRPTTPAQPPAQVAAAPAPNKPAPTPANTPAPVAAAPTPKPAPPPVVTVQAQVPVAEVSAPPPPATQIALISPQPTLSEGPSLEELYRELMIGTVEVFEPLSAAFCRSANPWSRGRKAASVASLEAADCFGLRVTKPAATTLHLYALRGDGAVVALLPNQCSYLGLNQNTEALKAEVKLPVNQNDQPVALTLNFKAEALYAVVAAPNGRPLAEELARGIDSVCVAGGGTGLDLEEALRELNIESNNHVQWQRIN